MFKLGKVHEAKPTSSGSSCVNMAGVMDSLFESFFSQAARRVAVSFNGEC